MFKGAKDNQYSSMGEGGHAPLQAFFGAGRGGANGRTHFAEFLAGVFGSGINIFADGLRSRFFLHHGICPSTLRLAFSDFPASKLKTKLSANRALPDTAEFLFGFASIH